MTALQELIQKLESFKTELKEKYDGDPLVTRGISIAIKEANDLLEKEKEQMINFAFNFYYDFSNEMEVPFHKITENKDNAEDYYNKTYNE